VIVDLYSSSFCAACTATRAVLDEAVRLVPAVELTERNVAMFPDAAEAEDVRSTPTVIVRGANGAEVFRAEGVPTLPQVLAALARAV
jgi:thiol-disulfide isomerase/thioredoxin